MRYAARMGFREDEKRWKRIQEQLAAEAGGHELKPIVSTRTLFGIPSTAEQVIERTVREEEERRARERRDARGASCEKHSEGAPTSRVVHPLDPVFNERSRVLLLGTMPSPKSREIGFYYGHPQNRFWRVLARLFDEPLAETIEQKRDQLLRHRIALWDVLAACDIDGASDASIARPEANDLARVLDAAPVEAVFCTGAKAAELYARLCEPTTGIAATRLPSTSPANAACSLDDLVEAYRAILPHLG